MSVIQFEVDEKLIKEVGLKNVKDFLQKQLVLLRLQYLGDKISKSIQESGIDHEKELEEVRAETWQDYKDKHLKDIL